VIRRWEEACTSKYLYFPARFTQIRGLPDTISHALQDLEIGQRNWSYHPHRFPVIPKTNLCWLDLTQLLINPYLELLFSEENRILHRLGRWDMSLRPAATPHTLLLDASNSQKSLVQAIGPMQVTYPPCWSLGIYYYEPSVVATWGTHALLRRVRRDNGIRIADLLEALEATAPELMSRWMVNAEELREKVKEAHWIDDLWKIPGTPRFRIYLDRADMSDEKVHVDSCLSTDAAISSTAITAAEATLGYPVHTTRTAYMSVERFRRSREREWVSDDLIEPAESTTGRHLINFNT
jgi:hypothetical protein